jgi:hypothetical protein
VVGRLTVAADKDSNGAWLAILCLNTCVAIACRLPRPSEMGTRVGNTLLWSLNYAKIKLKPNSR